MWLSVSLQFGILHLVRTHSKQGTYNIVWGGACACCLLLVDMHALVAMLVLCIVCTCLLDYTCKLLLATMRSTIKYMLTLLISFVALYILIFVGLKGGRKEDDTISEIAKQDDTISEIAKQGYVLTLNYTGQQAAGIRGLFSQQCWIKDFKLPMSIVTPFVRNSKLTHSQDIWNQHETASTFNDYYNITQFNKESIVLGNPVLTPWKQFIETASRTLIVVSINSIHSKGCLAYNKKEKCFETNDPVASMLTTDFHWKVETTKALDYLEKKGFKLGRMVSLDCDIEYYPRPTPTDIVEFIFGEYLPQEVTLLIDQWKFSIQMSPTCSYSCPRYEEMLKQNIHPSRALDYNVVSYVDSLSNNLFPKLKPMKVGVMIRTEWLMISNKHNKLQQAKVFKDCLKELMRQYNSLEDPYGEQATTKKLPLLALDIGTYGSSTFKNSMRLNKIDQEEFNTISTIVKYFVSELYQDKLSFEEWERTYTVLNKDGGYIAYMQNILVSKSDCLLVMGGGHFQEMAEDHYTRTHAGHKKCLYSFCTPQTLSKKSFR